MMSVKAIPDGHHAITPYLVVNGVKDLLIFLKQAFSATEVVSPMYRPDGSIQHAEVRIGDSMLMMGEPMSGTDQIPAMLHLYVEDVDATYNSAMNAGAESLMVPINQFYGDRMSGVKDHFGNRWYIATHIEDVTPEELHRRSTVR